MNSVQCISFVKRQIVLLPLVNVSDLPIAIRLQAQELVVRKLSVQGTGWEGC